MPLTRGKPGPRLAYPRGHPKLFSLCPENLSGYDALTSFQVSRESSVNRNRFRAALVCLVLAATALVLFGCSTGDLASLIGEGAFTATPKIAVVANWDTGTIASYTVNATSGALTEIGTSPLTTTPPMVNPWGIVVHPNGKWVYVADDANTKIQEFSVNNSTGALTSIGVADTTNFVDWVTGIAVSQDGKWVLTADCNANVSVFSVNQTTGALTAAANTPFSPLAPPKCLNSINVVNSKYVYVSGFDGNIWAFSLNGSTGALSELPGSPFAITGATDIDTQNADLTGSYLYIGDDNGAIYAAKINADGSLTNLTTGFPVSLSAGGAYQIAIDPRNKFLYVADNTHHLDGWSINNSTGALTAIPGSPWDTGAGTVQNVVVDPSGKFVYGSNWNVGDDTAGFSINQTTGALTPVAGSPFPSNAKSPNSMVITH